MTRRCSLPSLLMAVLMLMLLRTGPVSANGDVRAFFFGNSLINHETGSDETTVPHWLALLAAAGGHGFAADGTWGFARDFATELPPVPEWSIDAVTPVWDADQVAFRRAGFNTIIMNPENWLHYDPPETELDGPSVLELTARVFDWTNNQTDNARFFLYEGWANMEHVTSYPPRRRGLNRYHAFNMGEFHDWNVDYAAAVQAELPDLNITLIPAASVMAHVLTDTVLSDIPVEDIYSDVSPHGTATTYLLAAMVTYATLYHEPPPVIALPDTIHPLLRDNYAQVATAVWVGVSGAVLPDGASALPQGPLTDPAMGIGLAGIADWERQNPFIDVMKTARPWVGHKDGQWGVWQIADFQAQGYLAPDGWLTAMPPEIDMAEAIMLNEQPAAAWSLGGRYRMAYDGTGEVTVGGNARDLERHPGEVWFTYTPGDGYLGVQIKATDPADPVRNITVMRADLIPLYDAGERFNPDWLALIADMRSLRFMDWMMTNGSPQVTWADRPLPGDYTYGWRGVPVEVMVALANRVGADPWFTLPHMADDAYVTAFATYVRDHLRPDLHVYAEWSNEVWNWVFPQTHWAAEQGRLRWGQPGQDGWMQFVGLRAAQVADIWAGVFGPDQAGRLVRVIATQTGWKGLEEQLLTAPLAQAEGLPAPYLSFDAYAVTGYFGYDLGSEEMAPTLRDWIADGRAVDNVTDALRDGSLHELLTDLLPYQAGVAAQHDLRLVMYEGGTHLAGLGPVADDEVITEFLTTYNYSPEMAALYAELIAGWHAAGGTMFNVFVDVGRPSKWGSWGALRHLDDMNPRWATIAAFNALTPVTWETRAPGTFADQAPQD